MIGLIGLIDMTAMIVTTVALTAVPNAHRIIQRPYTASNATTTKRRRLPSVRKALAIQTQGAASLSFSLPAQ
jgi:hypothetical protein